MESINITGFGTPKYDQSSYIENREKISRDGAELITTIDNKIVDKFYDTYMLHKTIDTRKDMIGKLYAFIYDKWDKVLPGSTSFEDEIKKINLLQYSDLSERSIISNHMHIIDHLFSRLIFSICHGRNLLNIDESKLLDDSVYNFIGLFFSTERHDNIYGMHETFTLCCNFQKSYLIPEELKDIIYKPAQFGNYDLISNFLISHNYEEVEQYKSAVNKFEVGIKSLKNNINEVFEEMYNNYDISNSICPLHV